MHLIAFDIDGTLIDSDEFDSELFVQAVQAVLGIDIDDNWSVYRHVTDGGIMQIAEQRALRGRRASRRTYFGDGTWDQKASLELGYDFIAIGEKVEHSARYPDFRRPDLILARLGLAGL